METAVEEMIVETLVPSGEAPENSMDVEEKRTPACKVATESLSEENSLEATKISSGLGKNEERESRARIEGGTTSLALLAEAYDSSDSEIEETADRMGRKEEVRHGEEESEGRRNCDEENKERRICEKESEGICNCDEENKGRRISEEESKERRISEEESKEKRISEEENEVERINGEGNNERCMSEQENEEKRIGKEENKERRISEEENKEKRIGKEENEERRSNEEENKERCSFDEENKEIRRSEELNEKTSRTKEENSEKRHRENQQLRNAPEIKTVKRTQDEGRATTEYRNETQLSSSEDDGDSDSEIEISSSSAESDSEEETIETRKKNERNGRKVREKETKGEYDDLPPIEELKISVPEVLCDPLGEVGWMVEQMVVVKPKPGKPTLNLDTILFVERGRRVLGRIFDVFGQVSEPHYCVRFNSSDHIEKSEIRVGMVVYFCPNTEYTSVVFLNDLLKMKATEEIGDDEHPEFSDDEEERAYYATLRQKQRNEKAKGPEVSHKRQRTGNDGQEPGWRSNHPWSTGRKPQGRRGARANNGRTTGGEWPPANQEHNPQASPTFRPYGAPGANERWAIGNAYADNHWPVHPNQAPMTRPFFRPVHSYGHNPYPQNSRFPIPNFAWQSQIPPAPAFSWPFPPPPPPPPAI